MGRFDGADLVLDWDLEGVDADCSNGANNNASNACGIHVHSGSDCDSAGGHFWNNDDNETADPWTDFDYISEDGNLSDQTGFEVDIGYTTETDVEGKVLVVHDASGTRIACANIVDPDEADDAKAHSGLFALVLSVAAVWV